MTDPAIIEAAAQEMFKRFFQLGNVMRTDWKANAEAVLAAVTPIIEAAALERAAKVAEARKDALPDNDIFGKLAAKDIATAIRALIAKDSGGGD